MVLRWEQRHSLLPPATAPDEIIVGAGGARAGVAAIQVAGQLFALVGSEVEWFVEEKTTLILLSPVTSSGGTVYRLPDRRGVEPQHDAAFLAKY